MIYTSGSTGEPKGVAVTHRNLAHSTAARWSYYREPVAGYLLASSFAFDSSVAGIFWTLGTGGALVLPEEDPHLDLPGFLALFDRCRISHLLCLPALYRALLEADAEGRLAALAAVIVAGEACPRDLIDLHRDRLGSHGHTGLFNEYGPTEATVWSTVFDVLGRTFAGTVPIGRPIDRGRVHVLDRQLGPVPTGVFGEVYLGGDGLARGYLGKPAATAERFLPDPFSAAPGERLYRTGDLARWLTTGHLEFAGRADQQVKVRGFRIELREIERVLDGHPQVTESVAVAWAGEAVTRLAAYVAAAPDGAVPRPEALRSYLQGKLPEYMIPSALVVLDLLPRTPNGKVDRRALPAPGERRPDLRVPFRAPLTPAEEALAGIWREALRIDRVGADDPFLELGGDSILGLQVVSRASRAGYRFLLKDLFEQGTVARLAVVARVVLAANGEAPRPAVLSVAAAESYPLTPMQQGILFHSLYAPESDDYLVETVLGVDGELDLAVLEQAWRRLVARHPALRTVFRWEGLDRPLQVVLPPEEAGAAVHRHDLSGFSPEAAEA
ncbi:MAG TPA: AMP-binding protein, partial [Thermoanaerobaculia bacterium]|nr:AMP-binding protein [Thermoanaerobaculia bacterium]